MTIATNMRNTICVAALFAGTAAQADVTAMDVWNDWQAQIARDSDATLTVGAEEVSSGVVTIRDMVLQTTQDDQAVTVTIEALTFNEISGGNVRVTMDDTIPVVITGVDDLSVTLAVSNQNLDWVISGDPDAMGYAITADQYTIALVELSEEGKTIDGEGRLTANDLDLTYDITVDALRTTSFAGTIASIDMLMDVPDPESGDYVTAGAKLSGITSQFEYVIDARADLDDPSAYMDENISIAGGYAVDSTEFVFDIASMGDKVSGSLDLGPSTLTGNANSSQFGYTSDTNDIALNFLSDSFPLPVEASIAQYGVTLQFPVGLSEEPQDFVFGFDMIDFRVSDVIWDMFDPGNVLPRDPSTVQLALSGKLTSLIDIFDPDVEDVDGFPYEVEEITLERLNVTGAGAALMGDGAFTFDNSDTETFAPMPRPEGSARVGISGFNRLLDNLVAMGVVPEQDIMGVRMMVGMFARSTGDDQMETTVEVLPNGQVNVNGNRVR